MERIPVAGPWITQKEIDYVADAAANAWYADANVYHERFERAFAEYVGRRHAVALPSCTSAIHLALAALGVGPGDEVVVPDATWIASSAPVTYVGATPVFADMDERTWCLSAESFAECITPRTKAVIPVDLYGGMPDWDAVLDVARRAGVAVVEDSAEAVGSEYRGRKAGSFGDASVFSFHGSKTLTTGEGGMLLTDDEELFRRALFLRDHGRRPGDKMFYNREVAYKYKMSSMQAALGLAQLERVEELLERKRHIFGWYEERLRGLEGVTLNHEAEGTRNVYWMVTVILDPGLGLTKERLMEALSERGVDCRPFFHPLSSIPAYQGTEQAALARARNRVSYRLTPYGLNLPSGLNMTREKVGAVCDALEDVLGRAAAPGLEHAGATSERGGAGV
jgi:perosamine synthetase